MEDWTLPRQIFNHCGVTMSATEIVIFGGNEYGNDYLDIISVLDTTTGKWTDLDTTLPSERASMGCLATEIDGVEGALLTGGCINDCIVSLIGWMFWHSVH